MRSIVLALLFSLRAFAAPSLEGVFEGSMHLVDDFERDIPLVVNLSLTGEIIEVPGDDELFDEQRKIEGAFVVDEEGGPYAFSEVRYTLEKNQIDMRYNRPENSLKPSVPVSFRLIGKLGLDDSMSGKVISGVRGPMGTFYLKKTARPGLPTKTKYVGKWTGDLKHADRSSLAIGIVVTTASGSPATNPQNLEFEYTPGRMGHLLIRTTPIPFNHIVIDYLRRKIYLSDVDAAGRPALSYEATVDFEAGTLTGHGNGIYKGRTGEFVLKREF